MDFGKGVVLAKTVIDLTAFVVFGFSGKAPMAWMFLGFCIADLAMVFL